jgi:hypothetical protein
VCVSEGVRGRACQAADVRPRHSLSDSVRTTCVLHAYCIRWMLRGGPGSHTQVVTPASVVPSHGVCLGCGPDRRNDLRGVSPYLVFALTCAPARSNASAPTCVSLSRQRSSLTHWKLDTEGTHVAFHRCGIAQMRHWRARQGLACRVRDRPLGCSRPCGAAAGTRMCPVVDFRSSAGVSMSGMHARMLAPGAGGTLQHASVLAPPRVCAPCASTCSLSVVHSRPRMLLLMHAASKRDSLQCVVVGTWAHHVPGALRFFTGTQEKGAAAGGTGQREPALPRRRLAR